MQSSFADILCLEQTGSHCFRAVHHKENFQHTLFGGQVLAQAVMAAGLTTDRPPHSFHAYFLRLGSSDSPVDYRVSNTRDGKSFSHRSVEAWQESKLIFSAMGSFHDSEERCFEHSQSWGQEPPIPQSLPLQEKNSCFQADFFEFRQVFGGMFSPIAAESSTSRFWLRCTENLPDSALIRAAAIAYASDFGLLAGALAQHPLTMFEGKVLAASIDHSLLFHSINSGVNEWVLYDIDSPWAGGARGFARGQMFNVSGELIASSSQEGLIRPINRKS